MRAAATIRALNEEFVRGLVRPRAGDPVFDLGDLSAGKIITIAKEHAWTKFGGRTDRIPLKELRWDTDKARWVWWGLTEGAGEPGYDIPFVYNVKFDWNGKRWERDIEVTNPRKQHQWAVNRAVAAVLRHHGVMGRQLPLAIWRIKREGNLKVTDASNKADPTSKSYVPFHRGKPL